MRAYIAAYPVPPPLNLAAFAIDKLGQCLYWPIQGGPGEARRGRGRPEGPLGAAKGLGLGAT